MSRVVAVCAVHQLLPDEGTVGITAIDKRAVVGPVKIGPYGVYADVQADRKHHGGLEKALYAYSQEDAEYWAAELDRVHAPPTVAEPRPPATARSNESVAKGSPRGTVTATDRVVVPVAPRSSVVVRVTV